MAFFCRKMLDSGQGGMAWCCQIVSAWVITFGRIWVYCIIKISILDKKLTHKPHVSDEKFTLHVDYEPVCTCCNYGAMPCCCHGHWWFEAPN